MQSSNQRIFISYHAPALFDRALECSRLEQGVATVILCAASIEALTHDLTEWYKIAVDHRDTCPNKERENKRPFGNLYRSKFAYCFSFLHSITEQEVKACEGLQELEMERQNLEKKITFIFKAFGEKAPKGTKVWQNFKLLNYIRNEIVHVKGETLKQDRCISLSEENNSLIEGYPDFVKTLQKRGLVCVPRTLNKNKSWLELIEKNPKFLKWCIEVTQEYFEVIIKVIPDSQMSLEFKSEIKF